MSKINLFLYTLHTDIKVKSSMVYVVYYRPFSKVMCVIFMMKYFLISQFNVQSQL